MKKIILPKTELAVSKFIFGTANLFSAGTNKKRQEILSAAVDVGFSHFDTAPYYGFGLAESDLARIFKEHPELTFTTKVGIYPPGGGGSQQKKYLVESYLEKFLRAFLNHILTFLFQELKNHWMIV